MSNPVEILEQRLAEFWKKKETRKTEVQWHQWLVERGFDVPEPDPSAALENLTWPEFFSKIHPSLHSRPNLLQQLSDPLWLLQNHVTALPNLGDSGLAANVALVHKRIDQLFREYQHISQRVMRVEQAAGGSAGLNRPNPIPVERKPMLPSASAPLAGQEPPAPRLVSREKAQLMEKELTLQRLSQKPKPPPPPEEVVDEEPSGPKALGDVYLTYNEWLDQIQAHGHPLEPYCQGEMRVPSSHRISFNQFCKRSERKATDLQGLQTQLQNFRQQYHGSFALKEIDSAESPSVESVPAPASQPPESSAVNQEAMVAPNGFQPPDDEDYRSYMDWVAFLQAFDIDPGQFTSQDYAVSSSHQISFKQFCKRLERKLDDVEGFQAALR